MLPLLLGIWEEYSWLRCQESAALYDMLAKLTENYICGSLFDFLGGINWYNMSFARFHNFIFLFF